MTKHISLIMDGNRRFGKKLSIDESLAYVHGADKTWEICEYLANNEDFTHISFFAFSKDNNKRSNLSALENCFYEEKATSIDKIVKNFKCIFIGDIENLNKNFKNHIEKYIHINNSIENFKFSQIIIIFMNYSGEFDLEETVKNCIKTKDFDCNLENILQNSLVKNIPKIDLLIRTGNRYRISNYCMFLLFYSEIYFSKEFWPEFSLEELKNIINDYKKNRFCTFGA